MTTTLPMPLFNPETIAGISFNDNATGRKMRFVCSDADHWAAGWIVAQNLSGEQWMTWRKATALDAAAILALPSRASREPRSVTLTEYDWDMVLALLTNAEGILKKNGWGNHLSQICKTIRRTK